MDEDIPEVKEADKSTVEILDVVHDFANGGLFWVLTAWVAAQQIVIWLVESIWYHLPRAARAIGRQVIVTFSYVAVVCWNHLVQHAPGIFYCIVENVKKITRDVGHVLFYSLLPSAVETGQKTVADFIASLPELTEKALRGLGWVVVMVTRSLWEITLSAIHGLHHVFSHVKDFLMSSLVPSLTSFLGKFSWSKTSTSVRHFGHYCMARCQNHCPALYIVLKHTWSCLIQPVGGLLLIILLEIGFPIKRLWQTTIRLLSHGVETLIKFPGRAVERAKWFCQSDDVMKVKATLAPLVPQKLLIWMMACFRYSRHGVRNLKEKICHLPVMSKWLLHPRCTPRWAFSVIVIFVALTFILTTYLFSGNMAKILMSPMASKDENDGKLDSKMVGQQLKRQKEAVGRKANTDGRGHKHSPKVSDVIGLIARVDSRNHTANPGFQRKVLLGQIRMLRDAMLSEKTMLPELKKPVGCMGNLTSGEVEDIMCIPRPKYLSHIKNPCWYSGEGSEVQLKCLPYFHILGCAKAGTTDLWNRLMSHPHIVSNDGMLHKEALWWSWKRYGISGYRQRQVQDFNYYVDLFVDTSRQIQASINKESLIHQILITGDASPPDFWDFRGWVNISQNRNLKSPHVVTPHLMRHIYKDPKFILLFRDPIDRLYSDYFFVGGGLTSLDFHNDVLATVDMLARCLRTRTLQQCFHDRSLYARLPVRLTFACYSFYMREWLRVFPLDNFMFIKTEEYEKNPEETLRSVMEFLGLGPLKEKKLEEIADEERSRITQQRHIAGPMKNETKELLHQLLDPCSKELARLIKREEFQWS